MDSNTMQFSMIYTWKLLYYQKPIALTPFHHMVTFMVGFGYSVGMVDNFIWSKKNKKKIHKLLK